MRSVLALVAVLVGSNVSAQQDHTGPDHWYPGDCCSGRDCRKLSPSEYKMVDGVWYLRNERGAEVDGSECSWQTFFTPKMSNGRERVRPSRDFYNHGCFHMGGEGCKPLCFFPGGGV